MSFAADVEKGSCPLTVVFTGEYVPNSVFQNLRYEVSIGGSNIGTIYPLSDNPTISYTFNEPGVYTVDWVYGGYHIQAYRDMVITNGSITITVTDGTETPSDPHGDILRFRIPSPLPSAVILEFD